MTTSAISLRHVSKSYGSHQALTDVSETVSQGEIYGLIGRNGAGKTTLLKIVLGLSQASAGQLSILGSQSPTGLVKARGQVGYLVGSTYFGKLDARANLSYFCRLKGIHDSGEVDRALHLVGLAEAKGKLANYSMGMKQRFGIANALLGRPALIILDEPVNGLDPQGISEMRTLFTRLKAEGTTLVISSHLLAELALVADRFGILHRGRLVTSLTRSQLEHHTTAQRIEVISSDNRRAADLLATSLGIRAESDEDSLSLPSTLPDGRPIDPSAIADLLLRDNLRLYELHTKRQSLEDFYFSLTGRTDSDDVIADGHADGSGSQSSGGSQSSHRPGTGHARSAHNGTDEGGPQYA